MDPIADLAIKPHQQAPVTPLELLKDFADTSSEWHVLENVSSCYANVKNAPAVVMRHRTFPKLEETDLGFVATEPAEKTTFRLAVVAPASVEENLTARDQQETIHDFAESFQGYLSERAVETHLDVKQLTKVV